VESIIARLDEGGFVCLEAGLKPGQCVSVLSGPFAQTIGVLDRLDGRTRVRVLLEIMGAVVAVAMDSSNLTAA
jgi:transcriptional antiterminator RfaH